MDDVMKSEDQEKVTKQFELHNDDCLNVLRNMEDNSVDSIVTDPPYGMKFMGKKWDYDVPSVEIWVECLRVLKPGGHLLAFAGTRTQHRMAVRIEDAGFEIRDMISWVYGSGFPKSHDVSKGIDKAAGSVEEYRGAKTAAHASRKSLSVPDGWNRPWMGEPEALNRANSAYHPATEVAKQWQGWGTALKPALEPITVARKPFAGTVATNVLTHGTGALNVDGCRVGEGREIAQVNGTEGTSNTYGKINRAAGKVYPSDLGRWPANLIHDGSDEVTGLLGDAARFFYCPKASKQDRGDNNHPTVKPTNLMRYLCRLVTPPNGIVLDPFMGSGSTGKAAILEGFRFIGIERDSDYCKISNARIEHVIKNESKND